MIYHLLIPLLLLSLVIIQVTILDLSALGWIGIEISLIVIIYSGFHLDALRGGILSLVLGFFLDCLTSTIFGLYMFVYTLIFYLSMIVSKKVYAENPSLVAIFAGGCTLLEGLAIVFIYRILLDVDILYAIPQIFLPKAVVLGLLSPLCFRCIHHFGVLLHAEDI
jgi:rod shape-determining protein MreD